MRRNRSLLAVLAGVAVALAAAPGAQAARFDSGTHSQEIGTALAGPASGR